MRVAKWGNSLAVRLPGALVEALELKEGDEVTLYVAEKNELGLAKKPTQRELVERLRKYRGMISGDIKFDREEANAR